jgi:hypothetical protein
VRHIKNPETHKIITATHGQLVLLRQLVHTQDSNDILEGLVVLKNLLDGGGNIIVLLANNTRIQHPRLGVQGVNCWVNAKLGNTTGQHGSGVQVGKGGGGSRICQIIGRNVDSLHGRDGSFLGGGNALLPAILLVP